MKKQTFNIQREFDNLLQLSCTLLKMTEGEMDDPVKSVQIKMFAGSYLEGLKKLRASRKPAAKIKEVR